LTQIHESAVVHPEAQLGTDVVVGPFAIIEKEVQIGDKTEIGPHAIIADGTTIGNNCRISAGAVLGTQPQDLKFENEKTFVVIGDNTTIREYATVNRATSHSYYTRVGDNCLLMAYSHIAHDCQIGNHVVIANAVNMAGHVIIEDYVGVGGMTAIHQFVRIGAHTFIGGGYRVPKDVPPYILAMGEPLTFGGLNQVGLKRRGFSDETLSILKKAYRIIYRSKLIFKDALIEVENSLPKIPEIEHLLKFLKESERGVIR